MGLRDVFLMTSPAPKPWCAECQRTVKPSEFSVHTFLCLDCEGLLLRQVRQWATLRAQELARQAIARQRGTSSLLHRVRREQSSRPELDA